MQKELSYKNVIVMTNNSDLIYRKLRYELVDEPKRQPNRILLHDKLAKTVIMDCRTAESRNLKRRLGFNLHHVNNTKEQTVLEVINRSFEGKNMQNQYNVLG